MRSWARRAARLHDELRALAGMPSADPRWWLVAGGAALRWSERATYVMSDAEPNADTFIGHAAPAPVDPLAWAIAGAHAARAAIRELDGELPEQALGVTIERGVHGAITLPSALDIAAIATGERVVRAALVEHHDMLGIALGHVIQSRVDVADTVPFVAVSVGEEPLATARHGHRRGWVKNGVAAGPWLGLSRAGGLDVVSTCHMVVDGYGHAWLAARIAEHRARMLARIDRRSIAALADALGVARTPTGHAFGAPNRHALALPPLAPVIDEFPLGVAWRELAEAPRTLPLAYALGRLLHRLAGSPDARFSPTFQIPVARRPHSDPLRRRYRHVPAIASVRFHRGEPEPFAAFEARTRAQLGREAEGDGLGARLIATARALPAPLAWKRGAIAGKRPPWLESIAEVIGGRACLSRIRVDAPVPPSCAVSAPARHDARGGFVLTIVEDSHRAAITLCGTGAAGTPSGASRLLDQLLHEL